MNENIGSLLARLRKERGFSQKDLAHLLTQRGVEVTNQAVSKWENGISQPNAWQFLLLCHVLNISDISGEFLGTGLSSGLNREGREKLGEYAGLLRRSGLYNQNIPKQIARRLPLYDLAVSAGTGQLVQDNTYNDVDVYDNVPSTANFGVRIAGDSMEPVFTDGQTVWVQSCNTLSNNEIGIFVYEGNAYIKKLILERGNILLRSLNEKYADIDVYAEENFYVLGRVLIST